jgi:prepilin-type N-terminal cleavage/methylation domain-containing protein
MRSDPEPTDVGFTLLELMVVLAIILLVAGFTIPALTGLSGGNNLSAGGRVVANLLTVARSEAINRRAPIRFQVATSWPADPTQAYRKIALVQHDPVSNTDSQITGWQTLPTGVLVKDRTPLPNSGKYFINASSDQSPKLSFGGQTINSRYLEFTPNGAPNIDPASTPVGVCVVEGYVAGASNFQILSTDYYEIDVDALVGKTQVKRP